MGKVINVKEYLKKYMKTNQGDVTFQIALDKEFPREKDLVEFGNSLRNQFREKKPFPHIILSNFISIKNLLKNGPP